MALPVVFVHGLFGHLRDVRLTAGLVEYSVLAPDLIGYGPTVAPLAAWSLSEQADHVAAAIRSAGITKAHLVGHSVGGAVAALLTARFPDLVETLTSVEGNFTLKDAFWSGKIARMPLAEVEPIIEGYRADPGAWIVGAGVPLTETTLALAESWLAYQTAETVQRQAQAVVAATEQPNYLDLWRKILVEKPVHLVAGARSRAGWDVPDWAEAGAKAVTIIPETGHLMMAEQPEAFAQALKLFWQAA